MYAQLYNVRHIPLMPWWWHGSVQFKLKALCSCVIFL